MWNGKFDEMSFRKCKLLLLKYYANIILFLLGEKSGASNSSIDNTNIKTIADFRIPSD